MLRWIRSRGAPIAAMLLVSFVTLGGAVVSPHPDDCHDTCVPAVVHDAAAHHMRAHDSAPDSHPLHCLVCHWARTFRPHSVVRIVSPDVAEGGARVHVEIATPAKAAPVAQPPLRSPPAVPLAA